MPINGIIGISSELESDRRLNYQHARQVNLINKSSKRLKRLLVDIEEHNNLKNNKIKLSFQSINLHELVENVVKFVGENMPTTDVTVVNGIRDDVYVHIDPSKVQKIIGNIVISLMNFTQKGTITITSKNRRMFVEIVIIDDGVGIIEHIKDIIFEPIQGANNISNGHYGGTGLSLAIAKQLVELHKGKIWINKSLVDTTEFHLTLLKDDNLKRVTVRPFKDFNDFRDPGDKIAEMIHPNGEHLGSVLLIKDTSIHKKIIATYLYNVGYDVYAPENAHIIIQKPELNKKYDLVMIDEMLGVSNFELCKDIRKNYGLTELPVLIIVPNDRQANLPNAYAVGANDCIDHLFLREQLIAKVRTLVLIKKSTDEILNSQISFLQAQIQPHFLYNALNVITQLCIADPQRAHDVLLDFSQYLRGKFSFRVPSRAITLNDEINIIKSYLNVEKARFGERLNYEINLVGSGERMVPVLSIQPLVENAVKHGIGGLNFGGRVTIDIVEGNSSTLVSVTDNGMGMSRKIIDEIVNGDATKLGTGISNVNKRLKLYGCDGLKIFSAPNQGVSIGFEIPINWNKNSEE